jgi:diketogulonate reductase-like aldo/keto reductase
MEIRSTGAAIPAIGVGTFGSDHVGNEQMAESVRLALALGYRNIDCASVYGNEREIGRVIAASGIPRDELWITGKLWNDMHGQGKVTEACKKSLKDLGLDYLDLYLVHWPFPNYHPPKCDITSRSENARPYIHEEFMETWREMERLVELGLVRHIGTSNMTKAKLSLLLRDCKTRPTFQEMELHPCFQQPEFLAYVKEQGIIPIGFCPLGSPNRPERDMAEGDAVDMAHPIVVEIAKAHRCHPATICLKWAHANGIIPIPQSTKERNLASNLESVCSDPLSPGEIERLRQVDCNSRLVKGHVFLWKGARDWTDLWDLDGTIPCPDSYKKR